ncbi:hypothetical protein [Bradyrhizobium sp. USDA 4011]
MSGRTKSHQLRELLTWELEGGAPSHRTGCCMSARVALKQHR